MKKKIMLLGDSVRMFYTDSVKEKLGDEYEVWAPAENGRFAKYTLNTLRYWLPAFPEPDVIHWNVGLWDVGINYGEEEGRFTGIDEYVDTLRRILRELKKTGAKIIFATTTPVSPKKAVISETNHSIHRNSDIQLYNSRAVEFMRENNVQVNDLYSLLCDDLDKYIGDGVRDIIHPSVEGVKVLSDAVSKCIIDACGDIKVSDKTKEAQINTLDEKHIQ